MTTKQLPWRQVADELPPERMLVDTLTVHPSGEVKQGQYRLYRGRWFDRDLAIYMYGCPTHWRPAFRFRGEE